jgi:hypothetical protein
LVAVLLYTLSKKDRFSYLQVQVQELESEQALGNIAEHRRVRPVGPDPYHCHHGNDTGSDIDTDSS